MAELDHLVLAARTLAEGVAWCEQRLGITPGPGGRHPLMGTHNRLFAIGSAAFPPACFEILAIDATATHGRSDDAPHRRNGARPLPIEWGAAHPADSLPDTVTLTSPH